jgi:hypothetical protein
MVVEMNRKLEQKLVDRYPELFAYYRKKPTEPLFTGIDCGDGWFKLIDKSLEGIQKEVNFYPEEERNRFVLHRIEEKYGSLRIYMSDTVGYMRDIINDAYKESLQTCVICGIQDSTVSQNEHSFERTMCSECSTEYARNGWSTNDES